MSAHQSDEVMTLVARAERAASWGNPPPAGVDHLAKRLITTFSRRTGTTLVPSPRSTEQPFVPESRVTGAAFDRLARIAPTTRDDLPRRAMSLGKSYPDLMTARSNTLERATDAVVQPRTTSDVERIIAVCGELDIAVVPVGGGTSVVGGVEPLGRTSDQPVVSLDLSLMNHCFGIDDVSQVATFGSGTRGPVLERYLAPSGLTLGHVPQSFELATLGGWVATRSAGQASLRFGKIEQLTAALEVVTPNGMITVDHLPAHGAGPDVRELLMGSEGTCGVITQATMRINRRPTHIRFASFAFASFAEATIATRSLVQSGIRPTMVRVSDQAETAFNVNTGVPRLLRGMLGRQLAASLGLGHGSLVFVISTGDEAEARTVDAAVVKHMTRRGARSVGPMPARSWYRSRFLQPFARDTMLDRGLMVDTLETSATWSSLDRLHADVTGSIRLALGADTSVVGCHLSHLYRDGASCYFSFIAPARTGEEIEQWRTAKRAAQDAIAR
ncbi:MAG: FAD-binding oxidoreductase, partial [Thermoleophilia bacterium]|nr:FAD-binding oxidoreductase [Thermoleophilia bacterium]